MNKKFLKKLAGTALLLVLALDINHPVLASNDAPIDYSKLSTEDATLARLLKFQGKNPDAIRAALEKRKMESLTKGMSGLNLGSSQHEEIKKLKQENAQLKESIKTKDLSSPVTGQSVPQGVVHSVTEVARLQDENKKLSAALEGFQENSPTYKNLKEELERVRKELERAKTPTKSGLQLPPPKPGQLPPPIPQQTTTPTMTQGGPPLPGDMVRGGPPPKIDTKKSPEEIAKENNTALIKAIESKINGFKNEIESNKTISSLQNKEHLKLLIEEFFGALKTYAEQHPEVPGSINITIPTLNGGPFGIFVSTLGISSSLVQIDNAKSVEANQKYLPALIEKLNDFLKKTEDFIHAKVGNPFKLPEKGPKNLALKDILVPPKTVIKSTSEQLTTPKTVTTKVASTLKDTVGMLLGVGIVSTNDPSADTDLASKVSETLKDHTKVSDVIKGKAAQIKELDLLIGSATKDDIAKLWDTIPATIKEAKIGDLENALAQVGVKGVAGEVDFNALLKHNNIAPSAIGLAISKDDATTATFRDKTLKNFIALKLIAEIVIGYRERLGGTEDEEISKLQAKIGAYKTHMGTVGSGESPVKDTNVQRYTSVIKDLVEKIAELEKKKELYKEPLETANKMILKLEETFKAEPYVVPKTFKEFMDSPVGQKIQGKLAPKTDTNTGPVVNPTGVVSNTPVVSHDDHQMAVAPFKAAYDKVVGGDGKFIPKGAERGKHAFASLLELPATKFKALTATQEKTIIAASALETPDVIEALIYHLGQDKNAFDKNPVIHSLSTQLQAEAIKLNKTPLVVPTEKKALESHEKILISVKGQIGNIVSILKK
jgi:hypothetical protein